jgi:ketosteroid isomerase-like protein
MTVDKLELYMHTTATLATGGVDELAAHYWHEDIVFEEPASLPDAGVFHGRDAASARLRERMAIGAGTVVDLVEVHDAGGDDVLVELRVEVVPEAGGAALGFPWFQLATVRDGRIARIREFTDRDDARGAAGVAGG